MLYRVAFTFAGRLDEYVFSYYKYLIIFEFFLLNLYFCTMDYIITEVAPYTVLTVKGRLDSSSGDRILEGLQDLMSRPEVHLLLDFAHLDYISSWGLRTLKILREKICENGGDVRIRSISPVVKEVFDMTGFTRLFF